ncbi:MAG: DUF4333 domain-containing protein [Cyanobacteria bacterium]|nr:DUF4333 domain-containing protein [Cyanobacteriota bacterium]
MQRLPQWYRALALVSLCALAACSKPLDTKKIADAIKLDVTTQGAPTLKVVTCPQRVPMDKDRPFKCVGELENETRFAITVTQEDDKGTVKWDVPHTKGLLNLLKLQATIEQALQSQFGKPPKVDCGGKKYRSVKPGETFECKIIAQGSDTATGGKNADAKKPDAKTDAKANQKGKTAVQLQRPVRVLVAIDPDRNVTWQQVMPEVRVAAAPGKPGAAPGNASSTAATGTTDAAASAAATETSGGKKQKPLPPPTAEEIEELGLDKLD